MIQSNSGTLWLVATPIGNLEDMTFRAIRILKECKYVACEDTRVTSKLLKHFEIDTPMITYHQHSSNYELNKVIQLLVEGNDVALVSDAGYPIVSDPGSELTQICIEKGINITCVPGANAALHALVVSGLDSNHFMFYGFLDAQQKKRMSILEKLKYHQETIIFYEAPHRIEETIEDLFNIVGNRKVVVARELTKKFESILHGTLSEMKDKVQGLKGEIVIVLEGYKPNKDIVYETTIIEQVDLYKATGLKTKEAIKKVAVERQMSKNEVYDLYHETK